MYAYRKLLAGLLIAALAAPAATAQTTTGNTTSRRRTTAKRTTKSAPAVTADDIRQLREMMQQQQQQLNELRQQMATRDQQLQEARQQLQQAEQTASSAQQSAQAAQTAAESTKPAIDAVQSDLNSVKSTLTETINTAQEDQKKVGTLASNLGRFRYSGDVRVRYENFLTEGAQDRHRPRVRLRFNVEGKLNEDFIGGFSLASGATNDPTSTNSTLGDAFQRKPISFDRGFVTWNPTYAKWLSVTGGKFAYTWQRTSQMFDNDINPEGFSEKFSWDVKSPFVKNFSVAFLQLLLNETQGQANNITSGLATGTTLPGYSTDSWAFGGQIGTKLQLGTIWSMTPTYTLLNFRNPQVLINGYASLVNGASGSASNASRVTTGLLTPGGIFAPNGMTNSICVQTVNTNRIPTFCSQFLYSDVIVNNTFKTPSARFPVGVLLEYEKNLNAAQDNRSRLYQLEASIGQTKNKNDFQVGYAFTRSEQDAVIASFAESDQRFPTNVLQHRLFGTIKIAPNTTFGYTQWIGRALDTTAPNSFAFGVSGGKNYGYNTLTPVGGHEPWLKRGQLDLVYSF